MIHTSFSIHNTIHINHFLNPSYHVKDEIAKYYITRYDLKKGIPHAAKSGPGGRCQKLPPLPRVSGAY